MALIRFGELGKAHEVSSAYGIQRAGNPGFLGKFSQGLPDSPVRYPKRPRRRRREMPRAG